MKKAIVGLVLSLGMFHPFLMAADCTDKDIEAAETYFAHTKAREGIQIRPFKRMEAQLTLNNVKKCAGTITHKQFCEEYETVLAEMKAKYVSPELQRAAGFFEEEGAIVQYTLSFRTQCKR